MICQAPKPQSLPKDCATPGAVLQFIVGICETALFVRLFFMQYNDHKDGEFR